MQAHRKGTQMLIQKRLQAYDDAVKDGKSPAEAMKVAKAVSRKDVGRVRGQ